MFLFLFLHLQLLNWCNLYYLDVIPHVQQQVLQFLAL